jgi:hypothetical protein
MITSDPDAWEFQPENTIKLKPWEKDFGDTTLLDLIPMLQVGVLRSCVSWLLLQVLIIACFCLWVQLLVLPAYIKCAAPQSTRRLPAANRHQGREGRARRCQVRVWDTRMRAKLG